MNTTLPRWIAYIGFVAIILALLLQPHQVQAQTAQVILQSGAGDAGTSFDASYEVTTNDTFSAMRAVSSAESVTTGNSVLDAQVQTYSTTDTYSVFARSIFTFDASAYSGAISSSASLNIYYASSPSSTFTSANGKHKYVIVPLTGIGHTSSAGDYSLSHWDTTSNHVLAFFETSTSYAGYVNIPLDIFRFNAYCDPDGYITIGIMNYYDWSGTPPTWQSLKQNGSGAIPVDGATSTQRPTLVISYNGIDPDTYVPTAPSGLTVEEGETGTPSGTVPAYVLAWTDNADNDTTWQIQVGNSSNFSGQTWTDTLTTSNLEAWAYPMTTLDWSSQYWFRVRAGSAAGYSSWSNTATIETDVPDAPSGLTLTVKRGSNNNYIQVDWTDNSDSETGFIIERSADGNPPADTSWEVAENIETYNEITGWTLQTTTIYYRVGALSAVGDTMYTGWVSINVSQAVPPQTTNNTSSIIGMLPWSGETWFPYAAMFVLMLAAFGVALYLSRDRKLGVIFGGVGAMVVMGIFITLNWINGLIIMALAIAVAVIFLLPKVVGR